MTFPRTLSSFFAQRVHAEKNGDFVSILAEMCDLFGWTNATYLGSGLTGTKFDEDLLITTYSKDWVSRYFEQDYKYIDPIVSVGSQSLLPLDWSEISVSSAELKKFFGEANELGVGRSGLTVSVRGLHGDSSLFSVNSAEDGQVWQCQKAEIVSDLTYLAHLFHNIVLEKQEPDRKEERTRLTRREQDVLRWAAKGKTAWETAKILNLSDKTVSFYLSNVNVKLDVATKTQAVAKTISEKLLIM